MIATSETIGTAPDAVMTVEKVLLARQPIYNRAMGVYAYELLFRSTDQRIDQIGEDNATAQVLLNTFLTMGLDNLVGTRLAAINISEWYLQKADTLPVPPQRMILDIPSGIEILPDSLAMLKKLRKMGFTLALDQFVYRPQLAQLLPHVDMLKIDVTRVKPDLLPQLVKQYARFANLRLLALKVESLQDYRDYCGMGFDYCQGNLLSKPRVYQAQNLSSNKASVIQLLSVLCRAEADVDEIERIVSRDVSVSYKLFRLINSAFFALPQQVESIRQAVVMLGRNQLRSWISMLALNSLNDCPAALMELAITRGKMCEYLAKLTKKPQYDSYFTVGLFSVLDALMKQPLAKLISSLPLSDDVKAAILQLQGEMGQALKCVIAYENLDWPNAVFCDLSKQEISQVGYQSFVWGSGIVAAL